MTYNITPVDRHTTAQLSAPEDGDDLDAAQVAADLQLIADRQSLTRGTLASYLAWSGDFSVDPGGSLTSFTVNIGSIALLYRACPDGAYRGGTSSASPITQTAIEGGGGTLGASARWWYAYAFLDNSGVVQAEISLTAPGGSRKYKTGDVTRAYLGCFPTDTTGAPIPLRKTGGRVLYRRGGISSVESALGSNGLRAVDGATAIARTVLDLSSRVPPHSRVAVLYGQVLAVATGSSGVGALNLYTAADTTSIALVIEAQADGSGAKGVNGSQAEVELTSAQLCAYSVTQSTAAAVGDLDVLGWLE